MAYLKRRNKIWHVVFEWSHPNGERRKISRTLGTRNTREAKIALGKINEAENRRELDISNPKFDVRKFLNTTTRHYSLMLSEAIELFLEDHPHWSKGTYTQYETILYKFLDSAGHGVQTVTNPDMYTSLKKSHVEKYIFRSGITRHKPNGISNETRKKDLRHIKRFCNWLVDVHRSGRYDSRTTINPCDGITLGKSYIDYHKKMLTTNELHKVLAAFREHQEQVKNYNRYSKWGYQAWFPPLMWVYHLTGCRRGEPLKCRVQDILGNFEFLRMEDQKVQKLKEVFIKPELAEKLSNYIPKLPTQDPEQYLFPNAVTNQPLTGDTAYRVFKKYLKLAGLPKGRTIHGMRHHSVTEDLRNGIPINYVKEQHGHSSTAVTEIYEHLIKEDLKNEYSKRYNK